MRFTLSLRLEHDLFTVSMYNVHYSIEYTLWCILYTVVYMYTDYCIVVCVNTVERTENYVVYGVHCTHVYRKLYSQYSMTLTIIVMSYSDYV